jgi:hypothetical protein
MSKENSSGLGVKSRFGPVLVPDAAGGNVKTEGGFNELTIEIGGKNIDDGALSDDVFIPVNSLIIDAYATVTEAFSAGFAIGTSGSETDNGVPVAGTIGIETLVPEGTWAAALMTEDTIVGAAWETTGTDGGVATVTVRYLHTVGESAAT